MRTCCAGFRRTTKPRSANSSVDTLSLKPAEVAALLTKMADKKFGKGKCTVTASDKSIVVEGDKDAVEWALAEVRSLFVN